MKISEPTTRMVERSGDRPAPGNRRPEDRSHRIASFLIPPLLAVALALGGCGGGEPPVAGPGEEASAEASGALLLALAVLDKAPDGTPLPQPARLGILESRGGSWSYRSLEDADSNVFHKAMVYRSEGIAPGILTLGGTRAVLRLLRPGAAPETLWEADFGGKFSRMRDAEIGDLDGSGVMAIAVATHDQGVVAVVRPDGAGGWSVEELDRAPGTIVHEIELGDLDGDGRPEIYATPSAPNKLDGTPQPGEVVRYLPGTGEREVVADLGDRHAKEILITDLDGDGRDELYASVEAVAGGQVEILRYDADTPAGEGRRIAGIPDTLCRFLTVGDIDGDGRREMVAAAFKSGLWLLRPGAGEWSLTSIDRDSSGFEHAAILADLDGDGVDELFVASDRHGEVRRYRWRDGQPEREVLHRHPEGFSGFTWNIMPAPPELIP